MCIRDSDYLVRDYAVAVNNNWNQVSNGMFESLREDFSEEQLVELTLRIALCGFFNRFNDVLQIDMEAGALEDMLANGVPEKNLPLKP